MSTARRWSIEQHVRADADSIFVPADQLAGARPDDIVVIRPPGDAAATRLGHISERVADDARGHFYIVQLDGDQPPDPPSSGDA